MKNLATNDINILKSAIINIYNGYTKFEEPEYNYSPKAMKEAKFCKVMDLDSFRVKRFHVQSKATIEAFFLDYLKRANKRLH